MKALFFDGKLTVRTVDPPRLAPGEALIQVTLAGICGTDRQILKGYSGFRGIPGHEFVGRIVDTAEASQTHWIGKRVVGEINLACGRCDWCQRGLGRHCPTRTVMGIVNRPGAFAEFVALPFANLHEVPADIPDQVAVFTEPLAAAAEILEQIAMAAGTRVAVLGDGRLGLLVAQVLHQAGGEVTVVGKHGWKLDLARGWGLATAAPAELRDRSFAVVVEATGSPGGLQEALRLAEPRGTVVMKSTFHDLAHFDTAKLVVDEITLLGSRCGRFAVALDLIRRLQLGQLVSKTFALEEGPAAFDYLDSTPCLKVLLRPRLKA